MSAEPTPPPWSMQVFDTYVTIKRGQFAIVSGRYSGHGIEQDIADATLIIQAVNSHQVLRVALCQLIEHFDSDEPCGDCGIEDCAMHAVLADARRAIGLTLQPVEAVYGGLGSRDSQLATAAGGQP